MEEWFEKLIDSAGYFESLKSNDNIVCWGAGSKGRQTLEILQEKGIRPVAFIDNNSQLFGQLVDDIPIFDYGTIRKKYRRYCICITATLFNALEIYNMLQDAGEQNYIYFISNPFKAENKFLSTKEIEDDQEDYDESYSLLADEGSKQLFIEFLNWKITGDISIINRNYHNKSWLEYFDESIIPTSDNYCYIDVGAYTGDSICRFLAFVNGKYNQIIAFEPDKNNMNELKTLIRNGRLERIKLICEGLWSKETEKIFYKRSGSGSYESSNFFRDVNITLSNNLVNNLEGGSEKVIVRALDSYLYMLQENNDILLKLDALASEGEILRGAEKIIKIKKPVIVMEYGTHSKYIANIIPFLKGLRYDYKFYLRQHKAMSNRRIFLYAI